MNTNQWMLSKDVARLCSKSPCGFSNFIRRANPTAMKIFRQSKELGLIRRHGRNQWFHSSIIQQFIEISNEGRARNSRSNQIEMEEMELILLIPVELDY